MSKRPPSPEDGTLISTVAPKQPGRRTRFDHAFSPGRRITGRPTMAWRIVSMGRPATTPNAILAKRNTPFYASEISALQRGFRAAPLERPRPGGGDVNPSV